MILPHHTPRCNGEGLYSPCTKRDECARFVDRAAGEPVRWLCSDSHERFIPLELVK